MDSTGRFLYSFLALCRCPAQMGAKPAHVGITGKWREWAEWAAALFVGVCCKWTLCSCSCRDEEPRPKWRDSGTEQENIVNTCSHSSSTGKPTVSSERSHSSYMSRSFLPMKWFKQAPLCRWFTPPLVRHHPVNSPELSTLAQHNRSTHQTLCK